MTAFWNPHKDPRLVLAKRVVAVVVVEGRQQDGWERGRVYVSHGEVGDVDEVTGDDADVVTLFLRIIFICQFFHRLACGRLATNVLVYDDNWCGLGL